jgi:hypothetical protein
MEMIIREAEKMIDKKVVDDFMDGLVRETIEDGCKGMYFRCRDSQYIGSRGELVFKTVFYPLMKMSCPGCEKCGGLQEAFHEGAYSGDITCEKIVDGAIYYFDLTNVSRDWETGIIDDYDCEMVLQTQWEEEEENER